MVQAVVPKVLAEASADIFWRDTGYADLMRVPQIKPSKYEPTLQNHRTHEGKGQHELVARRNKDKKLVFHPKI